MTPAGHYTIRDLMTRLDLSKDQVRGFIRRGDLHAERHGGRSIFIPPAEAEAFIRFIESTREKTPDPERSRGAYCQSAANGRCVCRCHYVQTGREQRGAKKPKDAWLTRHDEALSGLVEAGMPPDQIAEELSKRFRLPRTVHATRQRIRKLGLSTRDGWVSGEDLVRTLGTYRRRIEQFEASGLLQSADYGRWRRYSLASVEQLIRDQAGRTIDPRRVKNPAWRSLAEVSAVVNARQM